MFLIRFETLLKVICLFDKYCNELKKKTNDMKWLLIRVLLILVLDQKNFFALSLVFYK